MNDNAKADLTPQGPYNLVVPYNPCRYRRAPFDYITVEALVPDDVVIDIIEHAGTRDGHTLWKRVETEAIETFIGANAVPFIEEHVYPFPWKFSGYNDKSAKFKILTSHYIWTMSISIDDVNSLRFKVQEPDAAP